MTERRRACFGLIHFELEKSPLEKNEKGKKVRDTRHIYTYSLLFVVNSFYRSYAVLRFHQLIIRFFFVMFPAKSFAGNSSQSDHCNQGKICRDCEESIHKVFQNVDGQVFLDDRLTDDQKMFLLNNPKSIERGLVDFIADQIETAARTHYHLHRTCIGSIDEKLHRFIPVSHDSRIMSRHDIRYVDDGDAGAILDDGDRDDDDEDVIDTEYDEDDVDDDDDVSYNVEDMLLDEMELEKYRN